MEKNSFTNSPCKKPILKSIAYIVRNLEKTGGVGRYTIEVSSRLTRKYDTHIFYGGGMNQDEARELSKDTGLKLHRLHMFSSNYLKKNGLFAINTMSELAHFAYKSSFSKIPSSFDIVHNQGNFWGKADVYTSHSCHKAWLKFEREKSKSLKSRLRRSPFNPLHSLILADEIICLKSARKVIGISSLIEEDLIREYSLDRDRITVIPNGVNIKEFSPEKVFSDVISTDKHSSTFISKDKNFIDNDTSSIRKNIRLKHNINERDKVLFFAAHQFDRKGLPAILSALSKLIKISGDILPDLKLLITGRDNPSVYRKQAERLGILDKIIFAGQISSMNHYYIASDLMVFPTLYEPFGLVITEALASGLPLIVSKNAGAAELLTDGEDALLLDNPEDINEIASALKKVLTNDQLCNQLSINGRKTAEKYSWNHIADCTEKLYQELFKDKQKRKNNE